MPDTAAPLLRPASTPQKQSHFGRPLRVFAWLSFLTEVLIIGTGGAVRLTGSGLGCSEWPLCTPESLVPTQELGIHGIIEFGNRTITGVVGGVAIVVLLLLLRATGGRRATTSSLWFAAGGIVAGVAGYAIASLIGAPASPTFLAILLLAVIAAAVHSLTIVTNRRDLVALAWIILVGVVAQAFVGGITVLTGLNPWIVGFHYVVSLLLVCTAAAFLVRLDAPASTSAQTTPRWYTLLTYVAGLALATTVVAGVLTTASGPHSGDANVIRDGFDATVLAHVHSWPGYILVAVLAVLLIAAVALRLSVRGWSIALVVSVAVQILVGVLQARQSLPPVLVGIHMVLAALSAAAYTVFVMKLKQPAHTED